MRKEFSPTLMLLVVIIAFVATCMHLPPMNAPPFDGYTLFAPMKSTITYLIDNSGEVIHTWESDYEPRLSVYLLENKSIIRTASPDLPSNFTGGGAGGLVQKLDWNGTVIWEFEYSNNQHRLHHDIEALPDGNVLMIAWENKTGEEAIAAGCDPSLLPTGKLWPDHIIEVEPTGATGGNIVWEWHVWDHLIQDYNVTAENYGVVADHPELIDINADTRPRNHDWNHINSVDYNEEFDQILLSVNVFNEIWVIDHSTTTEEAASHSGGNSGKGGDILYRWGNPQVYGAGDASDKKFFKQHDAQWIESGYPGEGNILVFNNGNKRPDGTYSSVDEIVPPVDENGNYSITPGSAYGPEEQTWIYTAENPSDFYSSGLSGVQRLTNGNTLICEGSKGHFFEVTPEKNAIWEYTNQFPNVEHNHVFKVRRYGLDFLLEPPVADISAPSTALVGEVVTFDGSGSSDSDGTIVSYSWEFGDTNTDTGVTVTHAYATTGNYTVNLTVTDNDGLNGTDTHNITIIDIPVSPHDVAITNVTSNNTRVKPGQEVAIEVTVENQGNHTEMFNVTAYADTTIIDILTDITLTSGNSTTIGFAWNTTAFGNYTISAYASPVPNETDVFDNTFIDSWVIVTIPGDVDEDNDVDIFDIAVIADICGVSNPNPKYDPNCDIDGDGDIDIIDVTIAAGNYGQSL